MKSIAIFITGLVVLFSCSEPTQEKEDPVVTDKSDQPNESVESSAKRHIESTLEIPPTEKYSYHIYKEYLDGDEKIDAIVTVNRLEYAMKKALENGKTAKDAELGFMGQYNYFFYYDGNLKTFSIPMLIASSPLAELKVSFENISSEAYKDILFDFRVLNGSFKDFYTITNHSPRRIFQWKNYVGLNDNESEAYYFKYDIGTLSPSKDILVMKGELIQPVGDVDIYNYEPEIKKTNTQLFRFFYHPASGKYMTKN